MPTRKPCASCCTGCTSRPTPCCARSWKTSLTNLFAGYDTSDDTFALSPGHDLLYTELVGTVMLYLESYGVQ